MNTNQPLKYKLLCYIAYSLVDGHIFSYIDALQTIRKYFGQTYQITTLRKEFSLAKKEGLIELKPHYHKFRPVLTSPGRLAIKTRLPFKKFGDWDGKWRLVLFDLPQKERPYRLELVENLAKLGFGHWQKHAYISPYPLLATVSRLASDLGIRQYLKLLTIEEIKGEEKIESSWQLIKINELYQNFIKKAERQMVLDQAEYLWPLRAKILEQEFAEIYATDPHLPAELLPKNWTGPKAYAKFKEISNSY